MRSLPKVTVLMSVYNNSNYLYTAVESILEQSFKDFELLIIDDGSREPVQEIISSFGDDRIRLIQQKENMGLTKSLNKGLDLAGGELIARMDADDISLAGRLEAQVDCFEADPGLDLVGTFFDIINSKGSLIEKKELITDDLYRLWRLQFHNNYGHGSVMFKKAAVINAGKYDERLLFAQDYDLWSRISRKGNTMIIPEVFYLYRMDEYSSQTSVKNYDMQLKAAINISNRNLMKCNPELSEDQCIDIRALYWKFQKKGISEEALNLLPETFRGFCNIYRLNKEESSTLAEKLVNDLLIEARSQNNISIEKFNIVINHLRSNENFIEN